MVYSLFDGKIRGIAATIIQSVIDGTIDIHYVFTKQFYKDYENICGEDNDMNEEQIYDDIVPEWLHSLVYINEIRKQRKDEDLFGVFKTKYFNYSGAEIACYVISNILNEFYVNEKVYIDDCAHGSYGESPHIMNKPDYLTGSTRSFILKKSNLEAKLNVFFSTINFIREPDKDYSRFSRAGTNLCTMLEGYDEDNGDFKHSNKYRGFMPTLLNAIFSDMIHRDIFSLNFYKEDEIELYLNDDFYTTVIVDDFPYSLYTPAQIIVDKYYPKSIIHLARCLYATDINFLDDKRYVVEKMLEIELEQQETFKKSFVWNILNEYQQKMINDYHQYFIHFLQTELEKLKNCKPEPIPDTDDDNMDEMPEQKVSGFETLIVHHHKSAVLKELHGRIDGRKGKDIGIVLAAAAYKYKVLTRTPTEAEFRKEFTNILQCSWRSISYWLTQPNKPENLRPEIQSVILNF